MTQRKRKKGIVSPNTEDKQTKKKTKNNMADNTSTQVTQQGTQQGTSQGTIQGSSYIMPPAPPMYPPSTPYYMNMNMNPMNPTSPVCNQQNVNIDVLQSILSRLDTMDSKLTQLNAIQTSVNKINERLNAMDTKINEIEHGQKYVSEQYDTLVTKTNTSDKNLRELKSEVVSLVKENKTLKESNKTLIDDVVDLKCRSMRDNLLFFGINEQPRLLTYAEGTNEASDTTTHKPEDCEERVFKFCEEVLKISDPKAKISIDRAHRIGQFRSDKTRPIVVKFKDTSSKISIQSTLKTVKLKDTPFNVTEQYPQEVKERRKELIPIMITAREEGKKAVLVRDKLYINNVLYTNDPTTSTSK